MHWVQSKQNVELIIDTIFEWNIQIDSDKIRTYDDKLEGDVKNLKQAASTTSWFIDECEEPKLVKKLQDLAIRVHRVMKSKDFCQIDCR